MTDRYFDKFPIISFSNNEVVDITKRVALLEKISLNPYVFYPYEITQQERADQFSSRYYEDSYKSWIIYLTNKMVDPYYEWYMSQNEFDEFIIKKYGSIERSMNKIYYYRNNWAEDSDISISNFNALPARLQLFWEPVYGVSSSIVSYTRKKKDWNINTNKIVSYSVSNGSFSNNEICDIVFDNTNTGTAQVLMYSSNTLYLQHTAGVTLSNNTVVITANSYIYGQESGVNTAFTTANLVTENIVDEEEVYWKAITYWDYENEKNEFNKTIRVLDNRYSDQVVRNFIDIMDE